ncbi:MAG: sterol desaturase family protein [Candidatus Tyrphobacter sp.]
MALLGVALAVLLAGDCASTFIYHVPQHAWFTFHLRTHHDGRRSYRDRAVLTSDPALLADGFLGALPYLAVAALAARLSWQGALLGLALGELHVWWRHTAALGWKTPSPVARAARALYIVTPEDHDVHHRNPHLEFGDIFRFYDAPARAMLRRLTRQCRHA